MATLIPKISGSLPSASDHREIVLDAALARAYRRKMQTTHNPPRPLLAILVGGLIVGVLDMSYAMLVYSPKAPLLIPQGIAGGVLGPNGQLGGTTGTTILGFILHFTIALGSTTVFYIASRQWTFMTQQPVISGVIFGSCVYLFMHFVVIPLSALPPGHWHWSTQIKEFIWHWFGVGLPIAFTVRHFTSGSQSDR
jgi:hypothetical protein